MDGAGTGAEPAGWRGTGAAGVTGPAHGVVRSSTLISLATQVPYRVLPLVRATAAPGNPPG